MKKTELTLVALVLLISMENCSPKKNDPAPSKTDLISKSWKLSGMTNNGADIFSSMDPCEKDNIVTFTKGGSYTADEGATKCNSSDPQIIEQGTWSLNGTTLTTTPTGDNPKTYTLNELTATTLKVTSVESFGGQTSTVVTTLSPK